METRTDGPSRSVDCLWRNARVATMATGPVRLGEILNAAIAVKDGYIIYVGPESKIPGEMLSAGKIIDCRDRWILPGFIDCHTHLVYAGDRSAEFEQRLSGATYQEIAKSGGGIVSSVRSLRAASEEDLLTQSLRRLDCLIAEGVTTIEIKSGYGLDLENERKSLRIARSLEEQRSITVRTTFLGAHSMPPEANANRAVYIDMVVREMLPAIAAENLADAVDGFCEEIAFSPDEIRTVFSAARAHGLPVKLHADQLSNSHAAALAAEFHALSADHLEYTDEAGVRAMSQAGTVAVLLPGAFYFLNEKVRPPVILFRKHRVPIAIGTDCNPGTSPLTSLLLAMNMAATLFGLTVEECLTAVTRHAARALGMLDQVGTLEVGKRADFCIWDIDRPAQLVYQMGFNSLHSRVCHGQITLAPRHH